MNYYIIIPAYNEQKNIGLTLDSVLKQTLLPQKVVVVNDNSSDNTAEIVKEFTEKYNFISLVNTNSTQIHLPGSKVIEAFIQGLEVLHERSEERRVGKECRSRWSPDGYEKRTAETH